MIEMTESGTMQDLDALAAEITTAIENATSLEALEAIRIEALGKKGRVSLMMRELGAMDPEARKQAGQYLNWLKNKIKIIHFPQKKSL